MYSIVRRFGWIRNRQYRQLRRLCCEILILSVSTLPEALLLIGASYLPSSSAAAPPLLHALLPHCRQTAPSFQGRWD